MTVRATMPTLTPEILDPLADPMRYPVLTPVPPAAPVPGDCGGLGVGMFPEVFFVFRIGEGSYACTNFSYFGVDLDGLCCFVTKAEAEDYAASFELGLGQGKSAEEVTFDEARDIARGKPQLHCLALHNGRQVVDVHYVR